MSFHDLAPELVHHIYNHLWTVSDVINLSLTCRRFSSLLRNAHKLTTLFAAADREFGPIEDIVMLVTYSQAAPAHSKKSPPISYALLRQVLAVGSVGKRFEQIYPSFRWSNDFISRRTLSDDEAHRLRRAMYRYWLYATAFHNRSQPRSYRLLRHCVEERSQLLRNWSNQEMFEVEEIRSIFEDILTYQLCPTDGMVRARTGKDILHSHWHSRDETGRRPTTGSGALGNLFHSSSGERREQVLSPVQARLMEMDGWGDEITQYHTVQSMLKLNPAQIIWLYDHATFKWEVEALVHELGEDWFWNNGQTLSDTWSLLLRARGLDAEMARAAILDGKLGVTVDGAGHMWSDLDLLSPIS